MPLTRTPLCPQHLRRLVLLAILSVTAGPPLHAKGSPPANAPVGAQSNHADEEGAQDEEGDAYKHLMALGYMDAHDTNNPDQRGVTLNTPEAADGLNLYTSRDRAEAQLMENDGAVVHAWRDSRKGSWMHVLLRPTGHLFAITKDYYLTKLDWNSKVIWRRHIGVHHDLEYDRWGRLYLLTRSKATKIIDGVAIPILEDKITVLSPTGELIRERSLFNLVQHLIPPKRIAYLKKKVAEGADPESLVCAGCAGDVTHANSIRIFRRDVPGLAKAGSLLLSIRELNRIVIIDYWLERVIWVWGPKHLERQHHASLLDNDHILLFDNGAFRERTRLLEVDPVKREIVWEYTHPGFYSAQRGAAQKLPNGNVLTTESDSGHAFEVTREGKIVWEFWNPDVAQSKEDNGWQRAVIYRLIRYPRDFLKR